MEINFELILKLGSLAGLFSFLYVLLKDIFKRIYAPKLKISPLNKVQDLRVYGIRGVPSFPTRKFANLQIENVSRNTTARNCVATMKFLKKTVGVTHLERKYNLHWADIPYSGRTTGAEPVDIRSDWRLDVVFTCQNQTLPGCWIAIPHALLYPDQINQAYLYPGEYTIKISIRCDGGKGQTKLYKILSPDSNIRWRDLDFDEKFSLFEKVWKLFINNNFSMFIKLWQFLKEKIR